ncbi:MAG: M20/M25/M40 family metallo-hydrolase [Clostridia bacterium]|nr:M20/M25/M40 family metallo-hydrolase [Clostridia bacterium]
MDQIFRTVDGSTERYMDFLCRICSYEARAYDKETIDRMVDDIAAFARDEGFQVTRTPMEACGDFLTVEINRGAPKGCLFQAHMDTVHEKGVFGQPPVRVYEDRVTGPGVIDCKGGIAIALLCMKALLDNGFDRHVRLILTSDEEISNILGGEKEIRFIQDSAAGFPCAINCETAERDEVVIARKAILKYRLDVKGVSGHSGKHYFTSRNAILEAAHKIVALHEKSVPGGTTYSCNIIQGGKVLNVIPDHCSISLDIRAVSVKDMETAMETVERIAQTAFVPGTSCEVTLLSTRPPMEKQPQTLALLEKLLQVCRDHDLGTLTPMEAGGGSDSCYTQAAGVTSICGMGASGGLQHTPREFLNKASIPLRAKILAGFLKEAD